MNSVGVKLSDNARALLLWLVAREHGLFGRISASHDDALNHINDLTATYAELVRARLAAPTERSGVFEPTEYGARFLRDGILAEQPAAKEIR